MKTIVYSIRDFEQSFLLQANKLNHELTLSKESLNEQTAGLSLGHEAVIIFTADDASASVIEILHRAGVKYIAVRAAGYDNVDMQKAKELGIVVANVPEYSPYSVAEHSIALMMALNRRLIIADDQVHHHNFTIEHLVGFDMHDKVVGVIGTGRIGAVATRILHGFGCRLLGYDLSPNVELAKKYNLQYVDLKTLCAQSDIITLYTPLNATTKYLINAEMIEAMKPGVMVINTARGAVMHTEHVIDALEHGKIGFLGIDVYENERGIFFNDFSNQRMKDPILEKLLTFRNVLMTPHQAFATTEALSNIAETTFYNFDCWEQSKPCENEVTYRNQ